MKIVFYDKDKTNVNFDNFWDVGTSGTVRAMISVAHGLSQLGHKVTILNNSVSGIYSGVQYIHAGCKDECVENIRNIIDIDFFIANNWASDIFDYSIKARKKIYWLHNYIDIASYEALIDQGKIDYIFCVSRHQLETFCSSRHFSKFCYLYHPFLLPAEDCSVGVQRKNTIMFVGALRECKGFHDALRIFLKFHKLHPEYSFRVAGSADLHTAKGEVSPGTFLEKEYESTRLQKLLYDNKGKIRKGIYLLGKLSRRELYKELSTAKLCLQNPSWVNEPESFGFALVEAQFMGVPIITTLRKAHAETVLDGETGYLIPEDSDELFVEKMEELLFDASRWESISKKAREFVLKKFDYMTMVKEFEGVLQERL